MVTSNPFSKVFGRSPIGPMQEHIEKAQTCAEQLIPFLEAVLAEDWDQAAKIQQRITELEHEADELKQYVRLHLPRSLFMPVPRSDLLELLSVQDNIANRAKDIAGLMLGRKMVIPPQLSEKMTAFLQSAISASGQAHKAMNELDELVETGFGEHVTNVITNLIQELDALEHEADELQVEIRSILFGLEQDLPPVDVMFLYKIIDWIGDLSDLAHRVGGRLQILLAR